MSQDWSHNLCSCHDCSACCGVYFCSPCMYGRTQWRLRIIEYQDTANFSWFNMSCLAMSGAWMLAIPWLPVWMQRRDIRARLNIQGGGCGDCMTSCLCGYCAQVQHEVELKERGEKELMLVPLAMQPPSTQQSMGYNPLSYGHDASYNTGPQQYPPYNGLRNPHQT